MNKKDISKTCRGVLLRCDPLEDVTLQIAVRQSTSILWKLGLSEMYDIDHELNNLMKNW